MKFGKSLSNQIEETLPEWRDKFLSYKDLKKRLKLIEPKVAAGGTAEIRAAKRPRLDWIEGGREAAAAGEMTLEESDFMELLEAELEKFNWFFVEKEEEYIIRLKVLTYSPIKSSVMLRRQHSVTATYLSPNYSWSPNMITVALLLTFG